MDSPHPTGRHPIKPGVVFAAVGAALVIVGEEVAALFPWH
jgi:hypothetical protein